MTEERKTGYPSVDKPWLKYYNEDAIRARLPECTIYEYLWNNNKDHPDEIALVYFEKKITYRKLFEGIDRTASSLAAIGIKQGDVITICSLTTPETVYCIYAAAKLGAICNIIEPRVNAESIVDRINSTDSKVLIILDLFFNKIKNLHISVERTVITSLVTTAGIITRLGFKITKGLKIPSISYSHEIISWKTFLKTVYQDPIPASYKKNAPVAIIYTSGTTGIPKGAVLTHDSVNSVAFQYRFPFPYKRGERFLDIMPPFIAYGLVCGIHMPLTLGLSTIIIPAFDPQKFDTYIIKYKPNFFLGVPSHYEYLLKSEKLRDFDLSFVKVAGMGGDALNAELEGKILAFLKAHNSRPIVFKGYGLTEMSSAAVSVLSSMSGEETYKTLGVPFQYNIVSAFEPGTDRELMTGEQGEICITGPGMMQGYYKNDEETRKVLLTHTDGTKWVHTQDLGYVDQNGFVHFVDRIKRMIVRPDGHNVWPSAIESLLITHQDVAECAVIGTENPNGANGKIPTAFIVRNISGKTDHQIEDELRELSLRKLPERDVALQYIFIEKIPLTPIGKVDCRALERLAAEKSF